MFKGVLHLENSREFVSYSGVGHLKRNLKQYRVFKFITQKPLWVNILAILGLIILVILLFFGILDWMTKHGKYETVPGILGMNVDQAINVLESKGFDVEIQDSIYVDTAAALSVLKQSPEPNATVKANRTIYLTINRAVPPEIEMPSLIGYSFRSAQLYLETLGLKLGDTTYKPDIAKNSVLEQLYNGKSIAPGTKLPMSSSIDLVLGSGVGTEVMNVPDLFGMTLTEARQYLSSMNINVGSIITVGSVSDQGSAFIVRQNPEAYTTSPEGGRMVNKIRPGQVLDLYISQTPGTRDTITVVTPPPPQPVDTTNHQR
jgi:beta-lactam-binding protein with PASTA domain